jgi:integrase/recombinase XerC
MILNDTLVKYKSHLLARGRSLGYFNVMRIWIAYLEKNKIQTFAQETITNFFIENNYMDNSKSQFIRAGRDYYTDYLQIPEEQNEWNKIKLIKAERKIPEYITEEELEKAIALMITHNGKLMPSGKLKALLHFLYFTGVRKQEVLNLKRSDFNFESNTATVHGKGKKQRMICFTKIVAKELQNYFSSEVENINAFNVNLGNLNYMPKILGKFLGRNVYLHLMRHSFARNLIYNKGVDINTVSKLLGHSSLNTTMIYVNPDEKTIKNNYKKLVG